MNILRNNRGVTLIFVAMGMLIFLLFLGLAFDTGWLVYVRGQGQARIDAAALAAAIALVEPIAADGRQTRAEELANVFGNKNSVNSTVDPENTVTPMKYDESSGELTTASSWQLWGGSSPICNAVRVTTSVTTSVFFAGIRNVFGAGETGQENIAVSAVSHLPCPGIKTTLERLAPIVLAKASWSLGNCGVSRLLDKQTLENLATAPVAKAPVPVPVKVGDFISSLTFVTPAELKANLNPCGKSWIVPVVDGGGQNREVVGFASLSCTGGGGEVTVTITLKCGEVAPSSAGTGECFGTYASNPILIQ